MKPPLKSLPLEVPPPGRPWHRTAVRLGWHPAAAALATMGWTVAPQMTVQRRSGAPDTAATAFFVAARKSDPEHSLRNAQRLLATASAVRSRDALLTANPQHPFLAAMAAVENLATLADWNRRGGPMPMAFAASVQCPFLTLLFDREASTMPQFERRFQMLDARTDNANTFAILDAVAVAALMACGFVPFTEVVSTVMGPAALFAAESETIDGLTMAAAVETVKKITAMDGNPVRLAEALTLPGYPPEEHPFFYAVRAAQNGRQCAEVMGL